MASLSRKRAAAALALALAALAAATSTATQAAPTWITVGEQAHALLLKAAPQSQTLASRAIAVNAPQQRGAGPASAALTKASETVYAMQVDDAALPGLSADVHEQLRKCGGFMQHASQAEALAALHGLARATDTPAAQAVPSYAIDNQAAVGALLPQMQASNILATIEQLASFQNRRHTSSHGTAASSWLYDTWRQLARKRGDVHVRQIAHTGFSQKSVLLEILGTGNGAEVVVLGGHLDSTASGNAETVRAPGADDDASGVASLTEVIRVLIANNYVPRRTLRFYAYAGEEAGLLGSKQIVAALPRENARVVGVMQLDMTAYQGSPTDLWIYTDYTNAAQNQFVASLAAAYLPNLTVGYDTCGYGCSDHASWFVAGYPVSFPFESSDTTYNMRLHTAGDVTSYFGGQANHALKFSQLALAFMVELGSDMP